MGAGTALITGGDPLSGAVGAVVGEAVAGAYRNGTFGHTPLDQNSPDYEARVEYGVKVAKVVTALCVGYAGGDIDAAVTACENAARHNALMFVPFVAAAAEALVGITATEMVVGSTLVAAMGIELHNQVERNAQNQGRSSATPQTPTSQTTRVDAAPRPFGNGQNTSSCLYRDPAIHIDPLPGYTALPESERGPLILSTPVHRPDSLVLTTPIHRPDPLILITPVLEPIPPLPGLTYPDVPNISILYMAKPEVRSVKGALDAMRGGNTSTEKKVHKNSVDYKGPTHVYRIKKPDGTTYKIGESAQGTRKRDGASKRAEEQSRKLVKETAQKHETEIRRDFESKKEAKDYETEVIKRFRRLYGEDSLPGNKSNH